MQTFYSYFTVFYDISIRRGKKVIVKPDVEARIFQASAASSRWPAGWGQSQDLKASGLSG